MPIFGKQLIGAAGANIGPGYQPHITSYDYDCPISEAGSTRQPGIGGDDKFTLIRDVIHKHTGLTPAPELPPPRIHAYGEVRLHWRPCPHTAPHMRVALVEWITVGLFRKWHNTLSMLALRALDAEGVVTCFKVSAVCGWQVDLLQESPLLDALHALVPDGGVFDDEPDIMEAYGQRCDICGNPAFGNAVHVHVAANGNHVPNLLLEPSEPSIRP